MKRRVSRLVLLALLAASAAAGARARQAHVHPLAEKVRAALEAGEPGWKFSERRVGSTNDPRAEDLVFRSRRGRVVVRLTVWGEESHAAGAIEGEMRALGNITRGKVRKLAGPGDEAYLLVSPQNRFERPAIFFRKANVYVIIYTASDAVAKRFAGRVAAEIPEGGVSLDGDG